MVELSTVVEAIVASGVVSDISKFDPNKTFKENKIDSLDVMSLFLAVEEKFQTQFTEEEVSLINSPAEFVNILNSRGMGD